MLDKFDITYKKILREMARSHEAHPAQQKQSTLDVIDRYIKKGQEENKIYYISFRGKPQDKEDLKGIEHSMLKNFKAAYKSTPLAVYAYPLIPAIKRYQYDGRFMHFAAGENESTQYQIFELTPNAKGLTVEYDNEGAVDIRFSDLELQRTYNIEIYKAIDKLYKRYVDAVEKNIIPSSDKIAERMHMYKSNANARNAYSALKSLLFGDERIKSNQKEETSDEDADHQKNSISKRLAHFFRSINLDYILDKGVGMVHINEPEQIVIFNNNIIRGVYSDYNRNRKLVDAALGMDAQEYWDRVEAAVTIHKEDMPEALFLNPDYIKIGLEPYENVSLFTSSVLGKLKNYMYYYDNPHTVRKMSQAINKLLIDFIFNCMNNTQFTDNDSDAAIANRIEDIMSVAKALRIGRPVKDWLTDGYTNLRKNQYQQLLQGDGNVQTMYYTEGAMRLEADMTYPTQFKTDGEVFLATFHNISQGHVPTLVKSITSHVNEGTPFPYTHAACKHDLLNRHFVLHRLPAEIKDEIQDLLPA